MSKAWYEIEANGEQSASVYLYDKIGGKGITSKAFVDELNQINASHVDLYVESLGGSVLQGTTIKSAIAKHPATFTAHIDSIAGSITSDIILACDEIHIADDAYVMIHNPSSSVEGEAKDFLKEAEVLGKMAEGMAEAYASRMNISTDEARSLMDAETWYRGQEAVDAGYADKTYSGREMVASFDPQRFSANAPAEAIKRFTSPQGGTNETSEPKGSQAMSDTTVATEAEETEAVDNVETSDTGTEMVETQEPAASVEDAVRKALAADRKRCAEIRSLGSKFGFAADASKFEADGESVDTFRAHILKKSPEQWKASLSVKNPTAQETEAEAEADNSGKEIVAAIKAQRNKPRT